MAVETIEQQVYDLGRGMEAEAVVVGSSAIRLAMPDFRDPHDVDVAVSPDAFAYLQQHPEWKQKADDVLTRDGVDVGTGWGGTMDFAALRDRSWQTDSGLRVAGLPDVYAYKQQRSSALDVRDMSYVRTYLQDGSRPPLTAQFIPYEVAAITQCLPEELRDDPEAEAAILLAANGLHTVYTLYGHPQIGQANQIMGQLERPEFQVPAMYHNGFELLRDAKSLQQHLANIGATTHDHLLALAIDPFTDAVYGNGRFSNNPEGYDELRSADLLRARALQVGFDKADADRMHAATLETAFDETTKSQRGKHAPDPLVRGVVGVDLQVLSDENSLERSVALAVEDGFSARYSQARTLGRVLIEHGARVLYVPQALELVDRYADVKPADAPDGPTVMQAFATRLLGNAPFLRTHGYPDGWTLNNPGLRETHAQAVETLGAQLLNGEITAVELGRRAAEHTTVNAQ
jgi:hypothetical protein